MAVRRLRLQEQSMENAAARIREYLLDRRKGGIECNEEGAMYHLFHEVNSLVTIADAHADSERQAKEFLRDTISDISHQLKTPIAALNIYNGILQQEAADTATVQEFTALSEQELDRIESLVQNLLKMARLDAGAITLEQSPENLSELLEHIREQYSFRAEQEGKEINLEGDEQASLLCDRTWLTEAIGNLVKNALDHTEQGDRILVRWQQSPCLTQITVEDTGSGIHPEDLYHIFKRFYRSRFSKDTQGIGLGLPLAKSIIEAHRGSIEVHSELGHGTTFIINFPIKMG
nr:HAMP domain-containing sensor histidine kinase [uncultured Oscillibacter sp.]